MSFGLLVVAFAVLGGAHIASSNRLCPQCGVLAGALVHRGHGALRAADDPPADHGAVRLGGTRRARRGAERSSFTLEASFAGGVDGPEGEGLSRGAARDVQERFTDALSLGRKLLTVSAAEDPQGAFAASSRAARRRLEQLLEAMARQEAERGARVLRELQPTSSRARGPSRREWLGCILVALLLAFGLRRSLVHPLRALTGVAREISETGDLTLSVPVRSGDEVGQLAGAFREMVERLRTIHNELRASGGTLATSAAHVRRSAEQQQETVSSQAAALHQTRITAEALRETSSVAAQRAYSGAQPGRAGGHAGPGGRVVHRPERLRAGEPGGAGAGDRPAHPRPGREHPADRRHHQDGEGAGGPLQHAGAQRGHRGGAQRRARQGLRAWWRRRSARWRTSPSRPPSGCARFWTRWAARWRRR